MASFLNDALPGPVPDAPAKTIQICLPDGNHGVRIATIDLAQDWPGIRQDLLQLIEKDPI